MPLDSARYSLRGARFHDLRWFVTIDSTNRWLVEQARAGARDGLVAIAGEQTAGRGRRDRRWSAPAGSALLCSVLVRPPGAQPERLALVSLALALAVRDAAAGFGAAGVSVKWPNDVMHGERKLAGILCEAVPGGFPRGGFAVVAGVGVNLHLPDGVGADDPAAPDWAAARARGVWLDELVTPAASIDDACAAVLTAFERHLAALDGDPDAFVAAYRDACATVGAQVRVDTGGADPLVGLAVGVDGGGRLLVRAADDTVVALSAGDVVHVRPDAPPPRARSTRQADGAC